MKCLKFYFYKENKFYVLRDFLILAPEKYTYTMQRLCEISLLVTRIPQI